jgi:diacylglycerol kinase
MASLLINVLKSFGFAGKGFYDTLRTQRNMKIHVVCAVLVVMLGSWLHISTSEWLLVVLCISSVWAAELLNTAVEYIVDLVSPDWHVLAGKAKDAAAAFVLVMALGAAVCGCIIFVPKILPLVFS